MISLTSTEAFAAYEAVRRRLPTPIADKPQSTQIRSLTDVADRFDAFLLDAFGVLNIGETAIDGTPERVADLQAAGKRVLVVSNAASVPPSALLQKYARLGYDFAPDDVITSRMAAIAGMQDAPDILWGVMGLHNVSIEDFGGLRWVSLGDDPESYDKAEGFLLVGSGEWTEARQSLLEKAIVRNNRPVRVANPDIVAPREIGFSAEPGYFAHRLADLSGIEPRFFGKPFTNIFDLAFARLGDVNRSRVLMVGDSLHTDILGAHAAGVSSALISDFGFFADHDTTTAIQQSGIVPDYVATRP